MRDNKLVVFITKNKFPDSDASAIRYLNLGKLFYRLGFDCFFVGQGNTKYKQIYAVDDFNYTSLRFNLAHNILSKLLNHLFLDERLIQYVMKRHFNAAYFVVGFPLKPKLKIKLLMFAKKRGIGVIFSIMEWYSQNLLATSGFLAKIEHKKNLGFYNNINRNDGFSFISISTYIHNYMVGKRINSINLPFIMDKQQFPFQPFKHQKKLTFIYAGNPGNKDSVELMLKGFLLLNSKHFDQIIVKIIGLKISDLSADLSRKEALKNESVFKFFGKLPNNQVKIHLGQSDFSVLMRPPYERYAKAGFPTKVAESLFSGVPVITNITSDLNQYLRDQENSLIVKEFSSVAFYEQLINAISLPYNELQNMKSNAYNTAVKKLDINVYLDDARKFIDNVSK